MIGIVNYGMGNLGSITNMLKKVGAQGGISSDPGELATYQKLILPGVGHFGNGMKRLRDLDLIDVLTEAALVRKIPILGICLGAQLMTRGSEESEEPGLGWISGETHSFRRHPELKSLKVPHMGWNTARQTKPSNLFEQMPDPARFYFVHSYYMALDSASDELSATTYGFEFTSGYESENLTGVQFHPEKSHKYGMQMMKNFSLIADLHA